MTNAVKKRRKSSPYGGVVGAGALTDRRALDRFQLACEVISRGYSTTRVAERFGFRAQIVRDIHWNYKGCRPPSGTQVPNPLSFVKNTEIARHAALFVGFYRDSAHHRTVKPRPIIFWSDYRAQIVAYDRYCDALDALGCAVELTKRQAEGVLNALQNAQSLLTKNTEDYLEFRQCRECRRWHLFSPGHPTLSCCPWCGA